MVSMAAAASVYPPPYAKDYHYGKDYHYAPAVYNFGYAVKDPYTYQDFGHEETRNGDLTKGSYYVDLPDGRRQIVSYYVDGYSGYVADVKYVGEAKSPEYKPAYKPAYYPAYRPAYWSTAHSFLSRVLIKYVFLNKVLPLFQKTIIFRFDLVLAAIYRP